MYGASRRAFVASRRWVGGACAEASAITPWARGAHFPRLLGEINWGNPRHPRVAIVGKGVLRFGSLDIKTAEACAS